jgi:Family of unknown function (DUF5996)
MARKLKTYQTSLGFFDLAIAAPSMKAALQAWGSQTNLFHQAYSHEVSSAGFWPGGGGTDHAAFYLYAYPVPDGFKDGRIEPDVARFDEGLDEFVLPYEAVRVDGDPERALMRFLQSTYKAAAETGEWDRGALEGALGRPGVPRPVPIGA